MMTYNMNTHTQTHTQEGQELRKKVIEEKKVKKFKSKYRSTGDTKYAIIAQSMTGEGDFINGFDGGEWMGNTN